MEEVVILPKGFQTENSKPGIIQFFVIFAPCLQNFNR
jgi:hypothetical protein